MLAALLVSALLLVLASLLVGQAGLSVAGRRDATWLAGPVGLAALLAAAAIVAGLGGRGAAIAITLGAITAAAVAILAARPPRPPRDSWPALAAAALAALLASLPFIAAGRIGILGVGLVNDDMAAHLLLADWIGEGFSPEPELIGDGYPLGPHALVAGVSELLGASSVDVFAGLVLAVPALTALVAFAALAAVPTGPRVAASALVALPYLAAAYLAQEAFKEPILALLVIAFALLLVDRPPAVATAARHRWGRGAALGVIAAGAIYVYSFPGLAWLLATLAAAGAAELWRRRGAGPGAAVRGVAVAVAPPLAAGIAAAVALSAPDLGRIVDFADFRALDPDRANEGGLGNLRGHISPLEALGVWPTSEFRLAAGAGGLPAAAFYAGAALAGAGLAVGLARWLRAHSAAIPAALLGAVAIYAGARAFGTVYTSAKALAIAAPLIALVIFGGLLAGRREPGAAGSGRPRHPGRARAARLALAAAIAVGMAASSFLVLRQAPVGPDDHLGELAEIRPLVAGEDLLFLGRDNFVLYGLRGSRPHVHVRNFYDPYSVAGSDAVDDVERKFDFDSVDAETLARFPFVLTTRAAYASGPPPGYEPAHETASYVLWRRGGDPRGREPVEDDLDPGAELDCAGPAPVGGLAAWLPAAPALASGWEPSATVEPGSPATVALELPPGDWELSLQYDATAPVRLTGARLDAQLPGSLDYRGATPFWPAGRISGHPGGPVEVEAAVADPPLAGRLLGARTVAHLGTIAATPVGRGYAGARAATPPFPGSSARLGPAAAACGRYADWVDPRAGR